MEEVLLATGVSTGALPRLRANSRRYSGVNGDTAAIRQKSLVGRLDYLSMKDGRRG